MRELSRIYLLLLFSITLSGIVVTNSANAACGANTRTWQADAASTRWDTNNNWDPANWPSATTENAVIVSDWFFPDYPNRNISLGCLEIQSGLLTVDRNRTLTIVGDYFRSPNANAFQQNNPASSTFTIYMDGTGTQDFDLNGDLSRLQVGNPTVLNIGSHPIIHNQFTIDAGSGQINLNSDFEILSTASDVTIPAGREVIVKSGSTFKVLRNLTINGILRAEAGARIEIGDGRTVTVASGGALILNGSAGNVASLDGFSGGRFTLNVAGSLNLSYFSISRLTTAGINLTGTLQAIENGDINYIATNGYGITIGAAASVPSLWQSVGFFEQGATGTQRNINATAFNGTAFTVDDWSGIGGTPNETDPNNKITWSSEATAKLQVSNATVAGNPPATINQSSGDTYFASFAFAMTSATTATDITSIKFTIAGSNNASDIESVKVYRDTNSNCIYNAGIDTQIGSTMVPIGSPATVTLSIGAGVLSVNDTTSQCVHVLLATSATAGNNNTIGVSIAGTSDVANSEGYDWSVSGAPPVSGSLSSINGSASSIWHGGNGNPTTGGTYTQTNNWGPNTLPTSTRDCEIGVAYSYPVFPNTTTQSCLNASLPSNGRMSWNNLATTFNIYGALTIGSNYTFTNAANGVIGFAGSANQSVTSSTTFPGHLVVNKTSGNVGINSNWTIGGDLTITSGSFSVNTGSTLTVGGNIAVNGGTLIVQPGATLVMSNGRTLTVGASGTLELVGTLAQPSSVTSVNTSSSYGVTINGTISANYYSFTHLSTAGVVINSGATINATNHLQNGSYSYPIGNGGRMLTLNRQIPGNSLVGMTFDANGSGATGITNIRTNTSAGTLTVDSFNGSWSGESYDDDATYIVNWGAATNTLDLNLLTSNPVSMNQGQTYLLANYRFKQTQAGAFNDTSITSIKVTLKGTATSSDISQVRAYYDATCSGSGGTLLGSASFSGVPATATISSISGATIQAHATTPPNRCIYFLGDIAALATNGSTLGISIESSADVTNSEAYAFNASSAPPVVSGTPGNIIGTTTIWTGASSTAWNTAGNWSGGVPTSTTNCIINSAVRNPVINTGTVSCNSLTIGNGTLNLSGGTLQVYGSFDNTGTFNHTAGTFLIRDNGSTSTTQNIRSTSSIANITFNKTAGGQVTFNSGTTNFTNLISLGASNNYEMRVASGRTINFNSGLTVNGATIHIQGGGFVQMGSGTTLTVNGGTFRMSGSAEVMPGTEENNYPAYYLTNKSTLRSVSGTYGFNATSGTVNLVGFIIENMNDNGLVIGGTTTLSALSGGQFAKLSPNYASMRALQINTTGAIPTAAGNIGFNWESSDAGATPTPADGYTLLFSSGCGNQTMDLSQWYGDWFGESATFNVNTKKNTTNCNLNFGATASAVTLQSFDATPYNAQVLLEWQTLFESEHVGFNVFRAQNDGLNMTQINNEIIRNNLSSTTYKGKYRFIDKNVENTKTYYYYIQDVDTQGRTELHGPVNATPLANLGNPPAAPGDVNDGGDNDDGQDQGGGDNGGPISNPSYRNLGGGVEILSQTSKKIRIKISPGALSFNTSLWDANYEVVSIPSYSKTQAPSHPELLSRVLLVDVNQFVTTHTHQIISETDAIVNNKLIAPAPAYQPNGDGVLEPVYSPDPTAYANSNFTPQKFVTIDQNFVTIAGKKMIRINVHPLMYQASSQTIRKLNETIVEITLDGNVWDTPNPDDDFEIIPGALADSIILGHKESGIHHLSYQQLVASGLTYELKNADLNELRIYKNTTELPLKIVDSNNDGLFNHHDQIIFYAIHNKSLYDSNDYIVLTKFDATLSGTDPKRMESIDANITGQRFETVQSRYNQVVLEQNNDILLFEPLENEIDAHEDLFIWKTLRSSTVHEKLEATTNLGALDSTSGPVRIAIRLKGAALDIGESDYEHHLELHINNVKANEIYFSSRDFQTINFDIDQSFFTNGNNTIKLLVPGTNTSALGLRDTIHIDTIKLEFFNSPVALGDTLFLKDVPANTVASGLGFASNHIEVFDCTNESSVSILDNFQIEADSGDFNAHFLSISDSDETLRSYCLVNGNNYLSVSSLTQSGGISKPLRSSDQAAHFVIIGHQTLLNEVNDLVNLREQQGIRTKTVSLQQIYAEYSNHQKDPDAIKKFLNDAYNSWQEPKLRYVLFLGDASYDLLDHFEYGTFDMDFPLPLMSGRFIGFASDHFYATEVSTYMPRLAVGRLPSNNPVDIATYVNKLTDYEAGILLPEESKLKTATFIAGKETNSTSDQFSARTLELSQESTVFNAKIIDWQNDGNNSVTKAKVLDEFNESPFLITYMGHGAPNLWGALDFIRNTDLDNLDNEKLPIVMALNCENAMFYDPDRSQSFKTVGESLIFNPNNGGAISFIGSSTQTTPVAQTFFAKAFVRALDNKIKHTYTRTTIGDLLLEAKLNIGLDPYSKDMVQSTMLFGDPSMPLDRSLFAPVNPSPQTAPRAAKKGGFGCSANASENGTNHNNWLEGILEFLAMILIGYILKRVVNFRFN